MVRKMRATISNSAIDVCFAVRVLCMSVRSYISFLCVMSDVVCWPVDYVLSHSG